MHDQRIREFSVQAASCGYCHRPIAIGGDCWRANRDSGGFTHPGCIAALILITDSPARLDYEIVEEVNSRLDEFCEMLCENPSHNGGG